MIRTYLTLEDMLKDSNNWQDSYLYGSSTNGPVDVMEDVLGVTIPTGHVLKSIEVKNLWDKYLVPYRLKEIVAYTDEEYENNLEVYEDFCRLFISKLLYTYDKYKKLIDIYTSEANTLMDKVGSQSINRFNDTPDNLISGVDPTNMEYTSHISINESSTDMTSKIQRLEEINKYWKNIYMQWVNEFSNLFIEY